jgi:hypothetical protein
MMIYLAGPDLADGHPVSLRSVSHLAGSVRGTGKFSQIIAILKLFYTEVTHSAVSWSVLLFPSRKEMIPRFSSLMGCG